MQARRADGDLEDALAQVEALAPEHLVLLGEKAERLARRVCAAARSSSAAGHRRGRRLRDRREPRPPTGGRARAVGGLGLERS